MSNYCQLLQWNKEKATLHSDMTGGILALNNQPLDSNKCHDNLA